MVRTYGAQQYAYQILTAVWYALKDKADRFAIEGDDFEDSQFIIDGHLAIGEAKYIKSKNKWTPTSLFYSGERLGPLLQLWNRWTRKEQLVLFSPLSVRKDVVSGWPHRVPDEELSKILAYVEANLSVKDLDELVNGGAVDLIAKVRFERISFETLTPAIIEWASVYGVETDEDRVARLLSFFSSNAYEPGGWLSKQSLLTHLKGPLQAKPIITGEINHQTIFQNDIALKIYYTLLMSKNFDDALSYAYGEDSDAQRKAFADTLRILMENDYVNSGPSNAKHLIYKSTYRPIYEFCRKNILERADMSMKTAYPTLTGIDETIFKDIFESQWFRRFLSSYWNCLKLKWNSETGLAILWEGLKPLAEFLEVLHTISNCFNVLGKISHLIPSTHDYNVNLDFDIFSQSWIENNLQEAWLDGYIDEIFEHALLYLGRDACTLTLFEILKGDRLFLCIPKEFAEKMTKAHRTQTSIYTAFLTGW